MPLGGVDPSSAESSEDNKDGIMSDIRRMQAKRKVVLLWVRQSPACEVGPNGFKQGTVSPPSELYFLDADKCCCDP